MNSYDVAPRFGIHRSGKHGRCFKLASNISFTIVDFIFSNHSSVLSMSMYQWSCCQECKAEEPAASQGGSRLLGITPVWQAQTGHSKASKRLSYIYIYQTFCRCLMVKQGLSPVLGGSGKNFRIKSPITVMDALLSPS